MGGFYSGGKALDSVRVENLFDSCVAIDCSRNMLYQDSYSWSLSYPLLKDLLPPCVHRIRTPSTAQLSVQSLLIVNADLLLFHLNLIVFQLP
jgi:hypothetical protein